MAMPAGWGGLQARTGGGCGTTMRDCESNGNACRTGMLAGTHGRRVWGHHAQRPMSNWEGSAKAMTTPARQTGLRANVESTHSLQEMLVGVGAKAMRPMLRRGCRSAALFSWDGPTGWKRWQRLARKPAPFNAHVMVAAQGGGTLRRAVHHLIFHPMFMQEARVEGC
eukprot:166564-Chlamydomonas_euryale.AAC.1